MFRKYPAGKAKLLIALENIVVKLNTDKIKKKKKKHYRSCNLRVLWRVKKKKNQ